MQCHVIISTPPLSYKILDDGQDGHLIAKSEKKNVERMGLTAV